MVVKILPKENSEEIKISSTVVRLCLGTKGIGCLKHLEKVAELSCS